MSSIAETHRVRPLVVRFGALGDMVILTVLIRHLHERFGEPVDILSSGGWTRPLLESQPGIGNLYLLKSRRWPYWFSREQQSMVTQLRARGPSATWLADYDNVKTRALLHRAGWTDAHACDSLGFSDLQGVHMCDLFLRFAYRNPGILGGEDLALTATDVYGQLHVSPGQRNDLQIWLAEKGLSDRPLILVQPGNKRTMRRGSRQRASNSKYWPEAHWAAVLRGLRERHPDHALLMLGVPAEADLNDEISKIAQVNDTYNVARELPVSRLLALSARARGMISVDTGPAHAAAAVGCPVVTLFGKALPQQYAPRGPGVPVECLTGVADGEQSILGIQPGAVLAAWDRLIQNRLTQDRLI
ncbi:MAG TPA: glycosyltransferase family 9 protein [Steroidobacteraceae bacterium]|nr:glycosyltransferase family 9 protein [Steroidobacteraceae bacterium]